MPVNYNIWPYFHWFKLDFTQQNAVIAEVWDKGYTTKPQSNKLRGLTNVGMRKQETMAKSLSKLFFVVVE